MASEEATPSQEEAKAPEAEAAAEDTPKDTQAEAPEKSEDTDWKSHARKHERQAKKSSKRVEELEAELTKFREATQSEQEKAISQARKEAAEEAKSEVLAELRKERLSASVARHAAGKFADVEDAIRLLDLDDADIFDEDGKVDNDNLKQALTDLLDRKPHLAASPVGKKPAGDADAGKGKGGSQSLEDMSVEDHLNRIRRHK